MSKTLSALAEPQTQTRRRATVLSDTDLGLVALADERATSLCLAVRTLPTEDKDGLRVRILEGNHPDTTVYCNSIFELLVSEMYAGSTVEILGTPRATEFVATYLQNEAQKYC